MVRRAQHAPPSASQRLRPPPPTRAQLEQAIGTDDFYALLAGADPVNAKKWRQMVRVQRRFKDAEPGYASQTARTYSESNRETLHRVALALLDARPRKADLYRSFISAHPAAFRENGAYRLSKPEQLEILLHTDPAMLLEHGNTLRLSKGALLEARWKPLVHRAAEQTRAARQARGLPITRSEG